MCVKKNFLFWRNDDVGRKTEIFRLGDKKRMPIFIKGTIQIQKN